MNPLDRLVLPVVGLVLLAALVFTVMQLLELMA